MQNRQGPCHDHESWHGASSQLPPKPAVTPGPTHVPHLVHCLGCAAVMKGVSRGLGQPIEVVVQPAHTGKQCAWGQCMIVIAQSGNAITGSAWVGRWVGGKRASEPAGGRGWVSGCGVGWGVGESQGQSMERAADAAQGQPRGSPGATQGQLLTPVPELTWQCSSPLHPPACLPRQTRSSGLQAAGFGAASSSWRRGCQPPWHASPCPPLALPTCGKQILPSHPQPGGGLRTT